MSFSCSQCNFTSQFQSAMTMHRQLDHNIIDGDDQKHAQAPKCIDDYFDRPNPQPYDTKISCLNKNAVPFKGLSRTNSATRLFEKIRTKFSKSKAVLSVHHEDNIKIDKILNNSQTANKEIELKNERNVSKSYNIGALFDTPTIKQLAQDSFRCHLCNFVADRITVLDRHLLNDHKIGLDNLLKLVMAKTKQGIVNTEDHKEETYYSLQNEAFEEGEFIIQTVVPRIVILKNAYVNTNLSWKDIPADTEQTGNLEDILTNFDNDKIKINLLDKMQSLDTYIHKLAESTDTLMKAQKKEKNDSKSSVDRKNASIKEDLFNLGVGDRGSFYDYVDSQERHSRQANQNKSGYIKPKSASSSFHY